MDNQKLAIVTGANKGIGFATVEQLLLHPHKYNVVLTSRDIRRGEEAVEKLLTKYPDFKNRLLYHQLDIASSKSIDEFVDWLAQNHKSFSLLINNAGFIDSSEFGNWMALNYKEFAILLKYPSFVESYESNPAKYDPNFMLPADSIKETLNVNVRGTFELTEKLLPYLSNDGKIITISSIMGELQLHSEEGQKKLGNPNLDRKSFYELLDAYEKAALKNEQKKLGFSDMVYAASKSFVNTYTRFVLPTLLKNNQAGFALHPGWIQTDLGGPNATGKIEDSYVTTMTIVNFSLEESKKNNGKYFDNEGKVHDF
jgi:carbonyl reductase 1